MMSGSNYYPHIISIHRDAQTDTPKYRTIWGRCYLLLITVFLLLFIAGCDPTATDETSQEQAQKTPEAETPTLEFTKRNFEQIKAAGVLRVLQPKWENNQYLPRSGMPANSYQQLIKSFATEHGLDIQWIPVENFGDLIPCLLDGAGDVIVTNLTQTDARSEIINFTRPLTQINEVLVVNQAHAALESVNKMAEQAIEIRVPADSSFEETAKALQLTTPNLQINTLSSADQPDDIIDLIQDNPLVTSIMDSNTVDVLKTYREGFEVAFPVSGLRNIAWGVRKESPELLRALNAYITVHAFTTSRQQNMKGDWEEIKQRKTLRVLTKNHPASYFIWRGELMGFDFDLIKRFADHHKLNLEVIVPPTDEDIIQHLVEGRGDLVAATMTQTPEREARGIAFTRPINKVTETLVAATSDNTEVLSLADLNSKQIMVNRHSSFWTTLTNIASKSPELSLYLVASPDALSTMDLIELVATGKILYTVADSHLLDIELTYRDNVKPALELGPPVNIAWATRDSDHQLLTQLNLFLKKEHRSLFFNVTFDKYFKNRKTILNAKKGRITKGSQLSPWDDITKKHAKEYEFDWRLITAQMYQESQFDPKAKSYAGAIGLMQVLPRTAKQMGFSDLETPESAIQAGVAYLDWTRDRFPNTLPIEERVRFSLASYNAGFGHVYDARRLAKQMGWDPNKWFNNVEKAMKLLSKPQYYQSARFGYCRGSEPVNYVRQIENRYHGYLAAH